LRQESKPNKAENEEKIKHINFGGKLFLCFHFSWNKISHFRLVFLSARFSLSVTVERSVSDGTDDFLFWFRRDCCIDEAGSLMF